MKRIKTNIYIDGFNLYYGSLKGTPYKWLDLKKLFQNLLNEEHDIVSIKYFTALISAPENDPSSPIRQQSYIRALSKHIPEFSVYYGHYLTHTVTMPLATPPNKNSRFVKVIKREEKGSDVNLALHLLNDSWLNKYKCAVLVSNDSDLSESLRLIKKQHNRKIGLVTPGPAERKPTKKLKEYADFLKVIRTGVLQASQLPHVIPGSNIHKPEKW